ncbi:hypothetical protein T484DRAFT_2457203 [Baffinella frigidus]|nr:hypothetical protein T484DRAFT_2457203 [Cryptophyta sp. CCMP2293]
MQEAQNTCETIYLCTGLTGHLRENRTYEWEVRIGNPSWIERSRSYEISWRHRPTLRNRLDPHNLNVSFDFISLPRRMDRSLVLLNNIIVAGFDIDEVRWSKGVDRDNYVSADDMLLSYAYAPVVSWDFDRDYSQELRSPRVKGKVGAWLAHLNIWRGLSFQTASASAWAVIIEDDVLFVDSKADFIDKISVTSLLYPETEIIYLVGREIPGERPFGRLSYVGVDAYAVKTSAAARILSLCQLDSPGTNVLALDAHLSALSIMGVIEARALVGGNAFVNRWSETTSDIEGG